MKNVYAKAAVFLLAKKKSAARVDPPKSHSHSISCRATSRGDSGIAKRERERQQC
jgi:hypothetical protein